MVVPHVFLLSCYLFICQLVVDIQGRLYMHHCLYRDYLSLYNAAVYSKSDHHHSVPLLDYFTADSILLCDGKISAVMGQTLDSGSKRVKHTAAASRSERAVCLWREHAVRKGMLKCMVTFYHLQLHGFVCPPLPINL